MLRFLTGSTKTGFADTSLDNPKLPVIEGSEEKLDRRSFLRKMLGLLAGAVVVKTATKAENALAGELGQPEITPVSSKETTFEYVVSKLGIDYRELTKGHSPLAEILSIAEGEWMKNATPKYGAKTAHFWEKSISKRVADATINGSIIEKLREFTPQMLQQFAVGLSPQDPKYGYLQSIGTSFVSGRLASLES